ncbi:ATP-binding domain-containing protein [Methylophaga sp.]|uniref:ATP-binding domain-containing protein n=1 Tax=Methylophaga sp. TaxID=2024840 RepID=UPI003A93B022
MDKALNNNYLQSVAQEELEVLDGIIDYAERMIREGDLDYRMLKRRAYSKALVLNREKGGITTYRLSMESLVYPNPRSGYATPHSPVGRLCSVAGMGYEGYSKAWGDYEVLEERQFRRHDFEELERHARNFLAMGVKNDEGTGRVMNLRSFIEKVLLKSTKVTSQKPHDPKDFPTVLVEETPEVGTVALQIVDDDDEPTLSSVEADGLEDEEYVEVSSSITLDDHFFLNRTRGQDKIISRSPVGPVWVEGVAGSGKTSAALGRTKMLCDFNSNEVSDREIFHSILGDDFDYWEGKFAGKFSQEGSVGFVRTAELIQYLKETCSQLGMPSLPVLEYHELRTRLRAYRSLETSGINGARYKHSSDEANPLTTTLAWLNASRREVGKVIADDLIDQSLTINCDQLLSFTPGQKALFSGARETLLSEVEKIARDLRSASSPETTIYGLGRKLLGKIEDVTQKILGPDALSILVGNQVVYGRSVQELAPQLARLEADLFIDADRLLVLYDEENNSREGAAAEATVVPTGASSHYQFLSGEGQTLSLKQALEHAKTGGVVVAQVPSIAAQGGIKAVFLPVAELFIRLGSPGSLLYLDGGVLKRIKVYRGLGSQSVSDQENAKKVMPRKEFMRSALDCLAKPLKNFAGTYSKALSSAANRFPDERTARKVLERLGAKRLNDSDIDLLLCLAHDLSAGVNATLPSTLRDPAYYQSVFVDEVQDFTEQQIYLMTSQADPLFTAVTVVGDRSQQLLRNEKIHIEKCFPIGKQPQFVELDENLRQMSEPELASFSSRLRDLLRKGSEVDIESVNAALESGLTGSDVYSLRDFNSREDEFKYICELISASPEDKSLAVVMPDLDAARSLHKYCEERLEGSFRKMSISEHIELTKKYLIHFTSVLHVKGLEFDIVLLPMIDQYDLSQPVFRNRLYVGCTRARKKLVMSRCRVAAK